MTMRAIWNDAVLAESDDTVVVEGHHYFPVESLREDYFLPSERRTVCAWKGVASYRSACVDGEVNRDAAWEYRRPSILARKIKNRVAFGPDVQVVDAETTDERAGS